MTKKLISAEAKYLGMVPQRMMPRPSLSHGQFWMGSDGGVKMFFRQLLEVLNQGRNLLKGMGGALDNLQETWPPLEQK